MLSSGLMDPIGARLPMFFQKNSVFEQRLFSGRWHTVKMCVLRDSQSGKLARIICSRWL
jgi:hypothetical protein